MGAAARRYVMQGWTAPETTRKVAELVQGLMR
jgi:hypothetical protein